MSRRLLVRILVVVGLWALTTWLTLAVAIASQPNRPPVARADAASIFEDASPHAVSGNVLSNDSDPDGDRLVVKTSGVFYLRHTTLQVLRYGTITLRSNGAFTYTLNNADPAFDALGDGQ
ncbi:MAG: Ig-like domain-containing protein, partial [Mycobacteriales bacterium]